MYTLKAYRGASTFEQTFTNYDAYLEKRSWLVVNEFVISEHPMHVRSYNTLEH